MSKNITIQEGGIARSLTADKLKTNLVSGGTCLWVPEDETQLQVKYIEANGEYEASADNVYGYSKVVVRVPGGAGGEGPGGSGDAVPGGPGSSIVGKDGDGDEAIIGVDGDGNITSAEKIPSSIKVLEPPTNPYGIYQDGQTISTNGMRVDAYLQSGDKWNTIPSDQITLDPTTAVYDQSTDVPPSGKATSELDTNLAQPINFSGFVETTVMSGSRISQYFSWTADAIVGYMNGTTLVLLFVSTSEDCCSRHSINYGSSGQVISDKTETLQGTAYTYDGKTVYHRSANVIRGNPSEYDGLIMNNTVSGGSVGATAWTLIYGDIEKNPAGSRQAITASWPQPHTGKPLTDTFEILVAPGYGGDEGDNGNAGTPPPGMLIP